MSGNRAPNTPYNRGVGNFVPAMNMSPEKWKELVHKYGSPNAAVKGYLAEESYHSGIEVELFDVPHMFIPQKHMTAEEWKYLIDTHHTLEEAWKAYTMIALQKNLKPKCEAKASYEIIEKDFMGTCYVFYPNRHISKEKWDELVNQAKKIESPIWSPEFTAYLYAMPLVAKKKVRMGGKSKRRKTRRIRKH